MIRIILPNFIPVQVFLFVDYNCDCFKFSRSQITKNNVSKPRICLWISKRMERVIFLDQILSMKNDGMIRMRLEKFGLDIFQFGIGDPSGIIERHRNPTQAEETVVGITLGCLEIGVAGLVDIEAVHGARE